MVQSPSPQSPSADTASSAGSGTTSKWCNTCRSALDLRISSMSLLPFQPPVGQYLEEALMGLAGGQHDVKAKKHPKGSNVDLSKSFASEHSLGTSTSDPDGAHVRPEVKRLISVLGNPAGAAIRVCLELFWVTVGTIFGCVTDKALRSLRERLAQSWYLLSLEANKGYPANAEERDWVMAALPYVFAQAIYRLLIDSFEDDRKHFIAQSGHLIEKITVITAYEVAGFQLAEVTIKKTRRRLFMKRVVKHPYVDQREFLRGQKRQEMLEQVSDPTRKLEFGNLEGFALEEMQLEHVLQGRTAALQGRKSLWLGGASGVARSPPIGSKGSSPGTSPAPLPGPPSSMGSRGGGGAAEYRMWKPPPDLLRSVDRYEELGQQGIEMLGKHLRELQACTGDEDPEDELPSEAGSEDEGPIADSDSIPPGSPYSLASGSVISWSSDVKSGDEGNARKPSGEPSQIVRREAPTLQLPKSPSKRSKRWKKAATFSKIMTLLSPHREKRELEAKQQREREQALLKQMNQPLPQELRERECFTTWVSPAQKRLYPHAKDRFVLQKTTAESFCLKMETAPVLARSQSVPALRPGAMEKKMAAKSPSGYLHESPSTKDDGSATGFSGRGGAAGVRAHVSGSKLVAFAADGEKAPSDGRGPVLPRVASAGGINPGHFTMNLEPPPNLSSKAVIQRLDLQDKAAEQQSFDHYRKAYDLSTGRPKQRLDAKRLRDDENAIQRKMHDLVGGEPIWTNTRAWKLAAPGASKMQANNLAAYLKRAQPKRGL